MASVLDRPRFLVFGLLSAVLLAWALLHAYRTVRERGPDRRRPRDVFYAPMIVDDAETAAAIRRQADVARAFAPAPSVTITMLAIGSVGPACPRSMTRSVKRSVKRSPG